MDASLRQEIGDVVVDVEAVEAVAEDVAVEAAAVEVVTAKTHVVEVVRPTNARRKDRVPCADMAIMHAQSARRGKR